MIKRLTLPPRDDVCKLFLLWFRRKENIAVREMCVYILDALDPAGQDLEGRK